MEKEYPLCIVIVVALASMMLSILSMLAWHTYHPVYIVMAVDCEQPLYKTKTEEHVRLTQCFIQGEQPL